MSIINAAVLYPTDKPRLRGVSHLFAFFSALGAGLVLVVLSPRSLVLATAAYAATLAAMFGVSALYHRPNWRPASRQWMRRLDHCTIFLLVAGTFTPFATLLPAGRASSMLALALTGALLGVVQSLFWVHAPKPLTAVLYLALGWSAVAFIPALYRTLGGAPVVLLVVGGILYSGGALVYALRRPDPSPRVFGYHEIFHALVVGAAVCHFAAVLEVIRAPVLRT